MLVLLVGLLFLRRPGRGDVPDLTPYPWLYLRGGEPLTSEETTVEVVAVGDVMLGRGVGADPGVFRDVAPWLRAADLTIGNLECVLGGDPGAHPLVSTDPEAVGRAGLSLYAPPTTVAQLQGAGFDLLGLANNHTLDLGPAGLARTGSQLRSAGIAPVGAGSDPQAAFQPAIHEVGGLCLAFLAFNGVPDGRHEGEGSWARADWDAERAADAVRAARHQADGVIVSVHWGYEYQTRVDPAQRHAAGRLLEAGADLVIGHHPHVVQPFETDDGQCVAYSLGNFVFDQEGDETGWGLALRAFFDRRGLRAVQGLPVRARVRPRLMTPEELTSSGSAGALLARVRSPRRLSFACGDETCHPIASSQRGAGEVSSPLFWGGRIDLTGDGAPEHVRRVAQQVVIYRDGAEVWSSPDTWRVVDLALGDPNDDGRGEILLASWKPGLDGLETPNPEKMRTPRSHPFIVGYRGGTYRTLWGGSAVSAPIHEVELGDVDGDADEELVVLDGDDPQKCTVSVWRWHGWGFSLIWRSDPGAYRQLSLSEDGIIDVIME
jgi:poly-gamma-glutamate synthesis protein (capsule biosynthesis protein)